MSIHPRDSFDEAESIRILTDKLESQKTIKTAFLQNDKTPNYDGSFELVAPDGSPVKSFLVQVKHAKGLQPNQTGSNKGKYVYRAETNFLSYVKNRVNENPAIYFLVDIKEKRIFWLYLSDAVLERMNFEGHTKVSYAFSEDDILTDIDAFTDQLYRIARQNDDSARLSEPIGGRQAAAVRKPGSGRKTKPIDAVSGEWYAEACKALRKMLENINEGTEWEARWKPESYTPVPVEWEWKDKRGKKKEKDLLSAIEKNRNKNAVYLLLGAPGSGKSVSLRKLALEMLDQFPKTKRLPLYINLSEWKNGELADHLEGKDAKTFFDSLLAHIKWYVQENLRVDIDAGNVPDLSKSRTFDELLRRKRFFFLFDSFDEMPCLLGNQAPEKTRKIADIFSRWFRKFLEEGNGGVLASRKEDVWPTAALRQTATLEVLEFDDQKIRELIEKHFSKDQKKIGERYIEELFTKRSELVPALRNPMYLSLFISFVLKRERDGEKTGTQHCPVMLSDLFDHHFETTLEKYILDNSGKALPSKEELLERAKDLAYQMQNSNRGLTFPVGELPARDAPDYWSSAIAVFKATKLCRGGNNRETVAFAHRRFQEYFYVSYLKGHPECPVPNYEENILSYTGNRDALILYCEVADPATAEEIAMRCWKQILERKGAIKEPIRSKEARQLAYALNFLTEAFRLRRDALSSFQTELEAFVCGALSQETDYVTACALVGCVSLLGEDALRKVFRNMDTERSLLTDAALRGIRLSRQIDREIGAILVAYLSGRSPITKWKQRKRLQFSFSLSDAFKPVKAYERWNRWRDLCALLCAVLVIVLGMIGVRYYDPESDPLENISVEEMLGQKPINDSSFFESEEALLSGSEAPAITFKEVAEQVFNWLKTDMSWEHISWLLRISLGLMVIIIFLWLMFLSLLQVLTRAFFPRYRIDNYFFRFTVGDIHVYLSRYEVFYRDVVFVPLFSFAISSAFVLFFLAFRPHWWLLGVFLSAWAVIAVGYLAANRAERRCIFFKDLRRERKEARRAEWEFWKRFFRTLRDPSKRKEYREAISSAVEELSQLFKEVWKNLLRPSPRAPVIEKWAKMYVELVVLFAACVLALAPFVGLGYLTFQKLQLLGVTFPTFQHTATAASIEEAAETGEAGRFWAYVGWALWFLPFVVAPIGIKVVSKLIIKKKIASRIADPKRAAVAEDLLALPSDAVRCQYVRALDEALEKARAEAEPGEALEGMRFELEGDWPGGVRPVFKNDELNGALARLDCEDERLRRIIP